MTENNAAHIAALEDLRLGVEMDRHHLPDGDAKIAALDAALASLRAPVADERALHIKALQDLRLGVEMDQHYMDDGDAKLAALDAAITALRWSAGALQALNIEADKITLDGETRTVGDILDHADRALASAPVAGEAPGTNRQGLLEAIHRYGNARAMAEHNIAYRDEVRKTAGALVALFDAAPQASTVDGLPVWWERFMNELTLRSEDEVRNDLAGILEICALDAIASAAPQASEAVRELPEAEQRALIGGYFAEDWAKEAAAGLLHDHARALAALSAQPGAQRTGGSDE